MSQHHPDSWNQHGNVFKNTVRVFKNTVHVTTARNTYMYLVICKLLKSLADRMSAQVSVAGNAEMPHHSPWLFPSSNRFETNWKSVLSGCCTVYMYVRMPHCDVDKTL